MQRRGAATPKIVVYLVFASLLAAIVAFIAIGYFAYQKDMILSVKPVGISMQDAGGLEAAFYQAKDADEPVNGNITNLVRTAEATMSGMEEGVWIAGGVVLLGVLGGLVLGFMRSWRVGLYVMGGCAIVAAGLGGWGWYLFTHRETPYAITVQPDTKNGAAPASVTFSTNDSTTIKLQGKNVMAGALKAGTAIQAVLSPDGDTALSIVSPIPQKKKSNTPEPKKGTIVSVVESPTLKSGMSIKERIYWGLAGAAALVVLIGLTTILKKHLWTGLVIAVMGGVAASWCVMYVEGLARHRLNPYDILLQPAGKGDRKPEPVKVTTDSSTMVKIDGEEKDIFALRPGMKVSAALSEDGATVTTLLSPIPEKKKVTLRLPEGFRGSAKRKEPQYLSAIELKDEYLVQSFSVSKGEQTFRVDQVDRDPLGFTAFARSLRLGALHDYRPAKILEEGPLLLADIPPVKWLSNESNPFGRDVNAYALVVEGFVEGKAVKCRQIAIQGEGTMMYVIKATAPAAEWPGAGEVFDSVIATFKLAAAAPATQPATQGAKRQAATAAATQAGMPPSP